MYNKKTWLLFEYAFYMAVMSTIIATTIIEEFLLLLSSIMWNRNIWKDGKRWTNKRIKTHESMNVNEWNNG